MDLYFLGSGSEKNYQYPRRLNTSLLITTSTGNIIVDVGDAFPDSWNELRQTNPQIEFPSTLVFTHAHQDHIKSLPAYLQYAKVEGIQKPTIYTTEKTRDLIERSLYWLDLSQISHLKLIDNKKKSSIHGETFNWFHTVHGDREPLGFKLNSTLFIPDFNGDIPKMGSLTKGLSTMIMECNNYDFSKSGRHNSVKKILKNKEGWKMILPNELILTHLGTELPIEEKAISELEEMLSQELDTKVTLSYDLQKIPV